MKKCKFCEKDFDAPGPHWQQRGNHFECKDRAKKIRKDRQKKKNLEKYGTENPKGTKGYEDLMKSKRKKAIQERFGVDNAGQSPELRKKARKTCQERYGADHHMNCADVREKVAKTCQDRYGSSHTLGLNHVTAARLESRKVNWITLSCGTLMSDFCREKGLSKAWAYKVYKYRGESGVREWAAGYKKRITLPEQVFIDMMKPEFDLELFDRKPQGFDKTVKPDFCINGLYVNIDGLYYHSDEHAEDKYHVSTRETFERNGERVIQFRCCEIFDQPNICKSIVLNAAGMTKGKINGRDCEIKKVSQKDSERFLYENHLMGATKGVSTYGLYRGGEICSLMSIRKNKKGFEISRFCNVLNTIVHGGFSKLLKFFEKRINPEEIISYCDMRYSTGSSYIKNGFSFSKMSRGFGWTDGKTVFNRSYCRANMDDRRLTEVDHSIELKVHKIYDAGQALYIKRNYSGLKRNGT